jgi:hypothetical protein
MSYVPSVNRGMDGVNKVEAGLTERSRLAQAVQTCADASQTHGGERIENCNCSSGPLPSRGRKPEDSMMGLWTAPDAGPPRFGLTARYIVLVE